MSNAEEFRLRGAMSAGGGNRQAIRQARIEDTAAKGEVAGTILGAIIGTYFGGTMGGQVGAAVGGQAGEGVGAQIAGDGQGLKRAIPDKDTIRTIGKAAASKVGGADVPEGDFTAEEKAGFEGLIADKTTDEDFEKVGIPRTEAARFRAALRSRRKK